jgi:hypothetical protein
VDELIQPILSLDLVTSFHNSETVTLPQAPLKYASAEQYLECWIPLFLFETYSQMISSKSLGSEWQGELQTEKKERQI